MPGVSKCLTRAALRKPFGTSGSLSRWRIFHTLPLFDALQLSSCLRPRSTGVPVFRSGCQPRRTGKEQRSWRASRSDAGTEATGARPRCRPLRRAERLQRIPSGLRANYPLRTRSRCRVRPIAPKCLCFHSVRKPRHSLYSKP